MIVHKKHKKFAVRFLALATLLGCILTGFLTGGVGSIVSAGTYIQKLDMDLNTNLFDFLDDSVVYQLPASVKDSDPIALIVQGKVTPLLDVYETMDAGLSFTEFFFTEEAQQVRDQIAAEKQTLLSALDNAGICYTLGSDYDTVIGGFEIVITAGDFEKVCQTFGDRASTYVSEVYEAAETQLVENKVNVYDTGIFNSSDFAYDGTGMVVAVLDTGLDYHHSAFSLENFSADRSKLGMTFDQIAQLIGNTRASGMHKGLTASDVYISDKVPFGFDYADRDPDVYPINSDHGTHVSGIIAGKDDTITGVAPNAQLVEMKIFSDVEESARASWILAAVEDCVVLGVDVINMSIGTPCGFSRETDVEFVSGVYQRVRDLGISLVVAASNNYNSTYGSEKNGNLPLTSNPDSATVGSPSTYEGAMSVASVSGVKTPYMLYNGKIIYFNESTTRVAEEKNFVEELLGGKQNSVEIEYVTIPGAGRSADYTGIDVAGKIVLVARGATTFEEKANVAQAKGAAGLIIYNNVSGDIKMNVGDTTMPVCSISQDDGETLAAAGTGKIAVSLSQTSGPFMSDFSSWGPGPDLEIKPEITAHGGSILSAVPGQSYDRISGTSMACPNVAGITALLRQYVIEKFPELKDDPKQIAALVNQLMMSTADILYSKNGLPYSVRKQGAGLANLNNCSAASAYIITYDRQNGTAMDKTKIELGDDPEKSGLYTLKFSIRNFGSSALTYELDAYVMTEGVSDTKTSHGQTTVTEEGYILNGASVAISAVQNGTHNGSKITVAAGQTTDVTVTITLSDEDKAYMDRSFENGMYVEGFVTLKAVSGTEVDMNVPYLAFYGDWTKAPIFDLDYYATNKDELDNALDMEDKTMADAYATRPIGGISGDYVSYLGSYYFEQDPADNPIAADRKYISLTNQTTGINSLRFVWAGLLRNAARVDITITDDATGEIVFEETDNYIRKAYGDGGTIYPANVDVEFSAIEHNLKNNTTYTVNLKAYLDYGDGGDANNLCNEFTFPLTADFEAPAVTDCEFYTEYDSSAKEMRYYAKLSVYDNHYSMGLQAGYVGLAADGSEYLLHSFEQYLTPIYSSFNSTSYVIYELTDYIDQIRQNATNRNTITVACYDYALNEATYEIALPDDFLDLTFGETELVISPYEVIDLTPLVYPETEWAELLEFYCTVPAGGEVARVVNNQLIGVKPGKAVVIARDPETKKQTTIPVTVLGEEDPGYIPYDKPVLEDFTLTGYYVNKAYYFMGSDQRDIGLTGDERKFQGNHYNLSMYPSESVTLRYILNAYFPKDTELVFESSNPDIVTVDQTGTITAVAEGFASVSVQVMMDGSSTFYSESINIDVKDPFVTTGASLTNYFGLGGNVVIPESLALTEIGNYAFANFEYIDKDPSEITEEMPEATKIWYIGDNTIETVVIPEGVTAIGDYAFANLTKLTKVVLPSTLERIDPGAFYGCTSLTTVEGLENVKFINQYAFYGCKLKGTISLDKAVAVADNAFAQNKRLEEVILGKDTYSVGAYAFAGCAKLEKLTVNSDFVKLGQYVFSDCESLEEVSVNTAVIPRGAFSGCSDLETVTLGKDVAVIGEYAFHDTDVNSFSFDSGNTTFHAGNNGAYITNAAGTELILVAPATRGIFKLEDPKITTVAYGAFSGCSRITSVEMPYVTSVSDYAFAGCTRLKTVTLGKLTHIGSYAFAETGITVLPDISGASTIGSYAFAETDLLSVTIPTGITVGEGAFSNCTKLESVCIGDNVILEEKAFYLDGDHNWDYDYYTIGTVRYYYYIYTSPLHSLTIGSNVTIGDNAFRNAAELENITLGAGAVIGDHAFYNATKLRNVDLSAAVSIGKEAFSGDVLYVALDSNFTNFAIDEDGYYINTYHAPALGRVDLTAANSIGDSAFAYCRGLTTVVLGEKITILPEGVFNGCISLANANLSHVQTIGAYAFSDASLAATDLSAATAIGEYAFCNNAPLHSVTFNGNGVTIDEGAFSYCHNLANLTGEEAATKIGDYAFAYTAVTAADLSAAETIGQHAFLKETPVRFQVTLGTTLKELGDNPFALCILEPFHQTEVTEFNGIRYEKYNYTYIISDTVQVIDGSLYCAVPNGLELITFAGTESIVHVAKDTVRISAMAFAGADVERVTLPHTVSAIGHKAFYGCKDLSLITFTSYNAPVLEEEYDYFYFVSCENISATGEYTFIDTDGETEISYTGLGIIPYFMWNASDNPASIYYGANFVDYIGHIESPILMVRPANGQNYDSFIFGQYFSDAIDGAAAADPITQAAIDAIDDLPETVSLSDKALVAAARAKYDLVSTLEQKALITNTSKLTQAEKRISDLEYLASNPNTPSGPTDPSEPVPAPSSAGFVVGIVIAVIAAGAAAVILISRKKGIDLKAVITDLLKKLPIHQEKTQTPSTEPESTETSDEE